MISIKQIKKKDIDLCFELDSSTISLWNKKQWTNEYKKEDTKIFGLLNKNLFELHQESHEKRIFLSLNLKVTNQKRLCLLS